jgi:hypothetical protein
MFKQKPEEQVKLLKMARLRHAHSAWIAFTVVMFVLGAAVGKVAAQSCSTTPTQISAPSWTGTDVFNALTVWNNNFYAGPFSTTNAPNLYPGEQNYDDTDGNGRSYGVILDISPPVSPDHDHNPYWGTFYVEGQDLEVVEDMYEWSKAQPTSNPGKYLAEMNNVAQGIIDQMWPLTNFHGKTPPWSGGSPYQFYGNGYTDTDYAHPENAGNGSGGDWFNDDLLWVAIAYERAWEITNANGAPVPGWQQVAQNQVDYIWGNARAEFSADGTQVGLLQSFCNKNNPKDSTDPASYLTHPGCDPNNPADNAWFPNMGSVPNFIFVIAAKMLSADLNEDPNTGTHNVEAAKVWAWAKNNLIDTASSNAIACSQFMANEAANNAPFKALSSSQTCAQVHTSNNTGVITVNGTQFNVGYNGMAHNGVGYWQWVTPPGDFGLDLIMNYGIAIKAALLMNDAQTAQRIANYLMYGISNSEWPYNGQVTYGTSGIPYNILPFYGSSLVTNGVSHNNNPGQIAIALRHVAYGINQGSLDALTKSWAQVNVQAALNIRDTTNNMWNNWCQSPKATTTGQGANNTYFSWDDGGGVVGLLTLPMP